MLSASRSPIWSWANPPYESRAASEQVVTRNTYSQRPNRKVPMVRGVGPFLGAPPPPPLGFVQLDRLVALHRPRDLERRRAEQPYPFADLAVERDHRLGRDQAVVAYPAACRVVDVVPEEAVPPDVHRGDAERRGRDVGVHDVQAVGDHRPAADDAHVG